MWLLLIPVIAIVVIVICVKSGFISIKVSNGSSNNSYEDNGFEITDFPKDTFPEAYFDGMRDKAFISMEREYYQLLEEIESDYSVLVNSIAVNDAMYNRLEEKCIRGTALFQMLVPLWEKYERGVPYSSPPYKRLAMIREKKGDYEGAALACVQQLRLGVMGDGTKGGMRGRLARMVKKGHLAENAPEAMKEISQYLTV